jgi:tetratricopeptide (TPR) repeat protein
MSTALASGKCQLQQIGILPVDMQGPRPLVWAKVNGARARFLIDSGAFYSTLSRDAAAQYRLRVEPIFGGSFHVGGVGGAARAGRTTIQSFEFLGVPLDNVGFLVIDRNIWGEAAGSIGQNLLRIADVEYDLADGIMRFIKPVGCDGQPLAYWAVSTPYSSIELQYMDVLRSDLRGSATVNGQRIAILFDTGAPRSLLSLQAAERAGITTSGPGVTYVGMTGGVGPGAVKVWLASNVTFQIGGEKVEHAHLLIADLPTPPIGYVGDRPPDMLLGEDFFLSHRIYVAYSQKKLYFTYNGGPLFNLDVPQAIAGTAKSAGSPAASSQADATTGAQPVSDAPTDADGFRRRGMARASMREFDLALADLTHACGLAPRDADNHYYRGLIYVADGQLQPALADFNTAITLQSDDIDARLARAKLLLSHPDVDPRSAQAQVKSDLDTVSRLVPPAAGVRQTLADLYGRLGDYAAALDELDQWSSHHSLPNDRLMRLNDRCWLLAAANRDLHEALADCDRALAARPYAPAGTGTLIDRPLTSDSADVLDSRGLVYIRLGNFKDAIRDYDTVLRANPKMPTSLYGRGLAELRLGDKARAQDDLAAAGKLDSGIARRFASMGLTP